MNAAIILSPEGRYIGDETHAPEWLTCVILPSIVILSASEGSVSLGREMLSEAKG